MTVGVAGLLLGGGSARIRSASAVPQQAYSKRKSFTADGRVRVVNACTEPDLFWALKGGGGGRLAP